MREAPFPWPWSGRGNRFLSLAVLAWLTLVHGFALLSVHALPISRRSPWGEAANARAPLLARFDSGWYDLIIQHGYPAPPARGEESAHAFFPLYPIAARLLHLATGAGSFTSALAVTYAALFLAVPLFAEEAKDRFGRYGARDALPFLLLYPAAFFLAAVYTESLFFLLALLAFRSVRRGELGYAILFGLLLGLTRAPAAAVGPGLAASWWLDRNEDPRRWRGTALLLVAPLAGVLAYIFGIGILKGETLLFFRSMSAWRHSTGGPISRAFSFVLEPVRMWKAGWFLAHPGALAPFAYFGLFVFLGAVQLRLRRFADAAWTASLLLLLVMTGTADSTPRYTLTVYPAHFAALTLCQERPLLKGLWLTTSLGLLLLNVAFFVNWHFVS